MRVSNRHIPNILAHDPKTLLKTFQRVGNGHYWQIFETTVLTVNFHKGYKFEHQR